MNCTLFCNTSSANQMCRGHFLEATIVLRSQEESVKTSRKQLKLSHTKLRMYSTAKKQENREVEWLQLEK